MYVKGYKRSKEAIRHQKLTWKLKRDEARKKAEAQINDEKGESEPIQKSNILTEINFNPEYEKMAEILNKKKDGKDKKYQCAECGATFDNLNEGKCPDCGIQLK